MNKFEVEQEVRVKPWDEIKDHPAFEGNSSFRKAIETASGKVLTIKRVCEPDAYGHGQAYSTVEDLDSHIIYEAMLTNIIVGIEDVLIGIMNNATKECQELLDARQEELAENMERNRVIRKEIYTIKEYL